MLCDVSPLTAYMKKNYAHLIGWKRVHFQVTRVQSCKTSAWEQNLITNRAHCYNFILLNFLWFVYHANYYQEQQRVLVQFGVIKRLFLLTPNCTWSHVVTCTSSHKWPRQHFNTKSSRHLVMRINKNIKEEIISWSTTKFSKKISWELYDRQKKKGRKSRSYYELFKLLVTD